MMFARKNFWGVAVVVLTVAMIFSGCDLQFHSAETTVIDGEPIPVTRDAGAKSSPAWSPDGSRIAYSKALYITQFFHYLLESGEVVAVGRLQSEIGSSKFDLSPDQSKIVYRSNLRGGLRVADIEQGNEFLLTPETEGATLPAWSPQGNWIVYQGLNPETSRRTLWIIPATGGTAREVTTPEEDYWDPAWSPDESKLVYTARGDLGYPLWILDLASGESRQFTPDGHVNIDPAWSPDGGWIAYGSARHDTAAIYLKPVSGGPEVKLSTASRVAVNPAWAPDGTRVAYSTSEGVWVSSLEGEVLAKTPIQTLYPKWSPDGNLLFLEGSVLSAIIEVISLQTDAITRVTQPVDEQFDTHPTWFPDGRRLAFTRRHGGVNKIWLAALDNGERRPLVNSSHAENNPDISPDGAWLLFDDALNPILFSLTSNVLTDLYAFTGGDLTHPAWGPDGLSMVCVAGEGLRTYTTDSTVVVQQSVIPGSFANPTWSNVHPVWGDRIAADDLGGIYIMTPDGSERELVIVPGRQPDWSPDASALAYVRSGQVYRISLFHPFSR
ncbi:MAG: hypothetical protein ACE5IY_05430 [bacterium]